MPKTFIELRMRVLYFLAMTLTFSPLYADDGFPTTSGNTNMPAPTSPYANSSNTNNPQSSGSGSDTFGSMVQTQTNQAVQTFQNVNYQKLSGNENQSDFFSDDNTDSNPPDPSHLFTVFSNTDNSGNN